MTEESEEANIYHETDELSDIGHPEGDFLPESEYGIDEPFQPQHEFDVGQEEPITDESFAQEEPGISESTDQDVSFGEEPSEEPPGEDLFAPSEVEGEEPEEEEEGKGEEEDEEEGEKAMEGEEEVAGEELEAAEIEGEQEVAVEEEVEVEGEKIGEEEEEKGEREAGAEEEASEEEEEASEEGVEGEEKIGEEEEEEGEGVEGEEKIGEGEEKEEGAEMVEGEEKAEEEEEKAKEAEEEVEEEEKEEEEKGKKKRKVKRREVQFGEEKEEEGKPKKESKKPMGVRKKSIFYQDISRFRPTEDRRVSGDFKAIDREDIFGSTSSPPSIQSFELEPAEDYYEEEEEEEEEEIHIDRDHYYALHDTLMIERNTVRMKNNFLHRKMADYFRKRKMEYVLKESNQQEDSQHKYDRKLNDLQDLKEMDTRERNSIMSDLNDLRSQRDDHLSILNTHFTTMQNREKEIGTGLINTKTGKEIPDKVAERLLRRQKEKWDEVAKLRLKYIKIRDKVNEKKTALHALDCIGDNLHLIDYEQLKIENQSHTDKIEERDEELTKLRVTCSNAVQCLAHVREKSAAATIDVQKLKERLEDVDVELMECRERLNYFKQERDAYRLETAKMVEDSGLLCKPKLLQDMEMSMEQVKTKTKQMERLEADNHRLKMSLKAIKRNISIANLKGQTKKKSISAKGEKQKPKGVYKGRPALILPELPESEWD